MQGTEEDALRRADDVVRPHQCGRRPQVRPSRRGGAPPAGAARRSEAQ